MPEITLDALTGEQIKTGVILNDDGGNFGAGTNTTAFIALESIDEAGNDVNICRYVFL